jgi:hypothetical protein
MGFGQREFLYFPFAFSHFYTLRLPLFQGVKEFQRVVVFQGQLDYDVTLFNWGRIERKWRGSASGLENGPSR